MESSNIAEFFFTWLNVDQSIILFFKNYKIVSELFKTYK